MAHKTLIGGTAYEIGGGKDMVGGTVYEIADGRNLIDGTVHEIAFSGKVTVNIEGRGNSNYCYVKIGNTTYTAPVTLEIEAGTEMQFLASSAQATSRKNAKITLNGSVVSTGSTASSGGDASYTLAPDCAVVNIALSHTMYGTITITTS